MKQFDVKQELAIVKKEMVLNADKGFCMHGVDCTREEIKQLGEEIQKLGCEVEVTSCEVNHTLKYVLGVSW